jgi:hypothetical protein
VTGNLTVTGNVTVGNASTDVLVTQAGTSALPAVVPTGDANTGRWHPAADTTAESTGGAEALRIDSAQRLLVGVTAANASGGVVQLKSGITFPATQVASTDPNTLDDYEEGLYTPSLTATGCTFAYTVQEGYYTKIGRSVFFQFRIVLSTAGNTLAANQVFVTNALPFVANSTMGSPGVYNMQWLGLTTALTNLWGSITAASSSGMTLKAATGATTSSFGVNLLGTDLHATNGTSLMCTGMYYVS